jgi:hypothetical protein
LLDLLLTNVTVSAKVTLGIPVIVGDDADAARASVAAAGEPEETAAATATDEASIVTASEVGDRGQRLAASRWPVATGGLGLGDSFSISAALSGCEMHGIGWIDADAVEALLAVVPAEIGRALLDARTGTLVETVSTAYRPPQALTDFVTTRDGTCRMWGCDRPAARCDIDHARPWPKGPTSPANLGGLCRRHHRLKQRRRWTYELSPDGTATWTSPSGKKRITHPDHVALPPPSAPPLTQTRAQQPQSSRGVDRGRERELVVAAPPPF